MSIHIFNKQINVMFINFHRFDDMIKYITQSKRYLKIFIMLIFSVKNLIFYVSTKIFINIIFILLKIYFSIMLLGCILIIIKIIEFSIVVIRIVLRKRIRILSWILYHQLIGCLIIDSCFQ